MVLVSTTEVLPLKQEMRIMKTAEIQVGTEYVTKMGRNCTEMPRSTAMVEALCAVAAGFAPEPTGHTTDLVFKGDDEIAAIAAVLGEA
jgi:hypothetical protein